MRWSWPRTAASWSIPTASRTAATSSLLLRALAERGVDFTDLNTSESSLEEIFVSLVHAQS